MMFKYLFGGFMRYITNYVSIFILFFSLGAHAVSQDGKKESLKVGVLKWGTVNWELKTLVDKKLDTKNKYKLEVVGLANKNASATALQGGEVDIIVTDF